MNISASIWRARRGARILMVVLLAALMLALTSPSAGVAADTIYVLNTYNGTGTIMKYTSAGVGSVIATIPGDYAPSGLAVDGSGNVYAAFHLGPANFIRKFTSAGVSSGFLGVPNVAGGDTDGLVFDSAGNLYGASASESAIGKWTPSGAHSTFASTPGDFPYNLAIDNSNNLYVDLWHSDTIGKFTSDGVGSIFSAQRALGLACDKAGNLYAAINNQIQKFMPDGTSSVFSNIFNPSYLAFDSANNLYVSVFAGGNLVIDRVNPSGNVSQFAVVGANSNNQGGYIAIQTVPEPSTLALSACVLATLALAAIARRAPTNNPPFDCGSALRPALSTNLPQ